MAGADGLQLRARLEESYETNNTLHERNMLLAPQLDFDDQNRLMIESTTSILTMNSLGNYSRACTSTPALARSVCGASLDQGTHQVRFQGSDSFSWQIPPFLSIFRTLCTPVLHVLYMYTSIGTSMYFTSSRTLRTFDVSYSLFVLYVLRRGRMYFNVFRCCSAVLLEYMYST